MRRGHAVWQFLQSAAALLLTVAFSPLIVVVGEPLRRYLLARPVARAAQPGKFRALRRSGPAARVATPCYGPAGTVHVFWRRHSFWMLWSATRCGIALTAPAWWLPDRASGFGRRGWRGPPAAGVRERGRPKPGLPGGSVALAEARAKSALARLLDTALHGPGHRDDREGMRHQCRGRRAGGVVT